MNLDDLVSFRLSLSAVRLVSVLEFYECRVVLSLELQLTTSQRATNAEQPRAVATIYVEALTNHPLERYWDIANRDSLSRELFRRSFTATISQKTLQPRKLVGYTRRLMAEDFGML